MSRLQTTPIITVYKITDLFTALSAKIAEYDAQLKGVSGWKIYHSPAASRAALQNIMLELQSWQKTGHDYAVTDRPFSDGDITGDMGDSIISQFGSAAVPQRKETCRVNPLRAGVLKQFGLDI